MRVLMLSIDRTVFNDESLVRGRTDAYALALGHLDTIVFTLKKHGITQVVHTPTLTITPTNSLVRLLYGIDTLRLLNPKQAYDVITVQDPFEIGLLGLCIARWKYIPLHVQVHTDLFNPEFTRYSWWNVGRQLLARFVLRYADRVRVVSERVRTDIVKEIKTLSQKNISVLPIFVDIQRFKNATTPVGISERFASFKKKLLIVSRLEKEKNVVFAIESFAQSTYKDSCLIIVGSGRELSALQQRVSDLGITERVFFEGYHDPFDYYGLADLLLVPSHYEGYGMVIIEAIARGVPVLSRDVGVAVELGARVAFDNEWPVTMDDILLRGERSILISYPYESWQSYVRSWRNDVASCLPIARRLAEVSMHKPLIGFIGQGFIGKNYADDFERRGYNTVRYALEEPYLNNKEKISECDITFIAVPTPTTDKRFDDSIVRAALKHIGHGKIAVIKSTIVPGSTKSFQTDNPLITVLYSPEFLSEVTASYDAAHPFSNIIGMTIDSDVQLLAAEKVLSVLPEAPFSQITSSTEAEIIKYTHNLSGYTQIIFFNLMYDMAHTNGVAWDAIREALTNDPYIANRYSNPIHKSGRGAGGHCFIKDMAALREVYELNRSEDTAGIGVLRAMEAKNIDLLTSTQKDLDLLQGVYGDVAPL